jgi:hypothetical protein
MPIIMPVKIGSEEYEKRAKRFENPAFTFDETFTRKRTIGEIKFYLETFKAAYSEKKDYDNTIELLKIRYGIDEKDIVDMVKQSKLYRKTLGEHASKNIFPSIVSSHDIDNTYELMKITRSDNIEASLMKYGIEMNEENAKELFFMSKYLGSKNKNIESQIDKIFTEIYNADISLRKKSNLENYIKQSKKQDLRSRFRLNDKPSEDELMSAAMRYSNVLNEFYNPEELALTEANIRADRNMHNNITEITGSTEISASRIRSFARELEKDNKVREYRIMRFGYNSRDLTQDMIDNIYSDKLSGLTYKKLAEKYNLYNEYAARKAAFLHLHKDNALSALRKNLSKQKDLLSEQKYLLDHSLKNYSLRDYPLKNNKNDKIVNFSRGEMLSQKEHMIMYNR